MKFLYGSVITVCGPSQCGKTVFVEKILKNPHKFLVSPPSRIIWHYGTSKPPSAMQQVFYRKGLPTWDTSKLPEKSIVVIDDLMHESKNDRFVTSLMTKVAHHRQSIIIFLSQNLFYQSSESRTRNLNTHYLILFKNPRDKLTVYVLQRQMCMDHLISSYLDATENKPYSYLLIDFRQETRDDERIRADIHENEVIYKPKKSINMVEEFEQCRI